MSTIIDGAALKNLQSRLEKEKAAKNVCQMQIKEMREKEKDHDRKIDLLVKQIKELTREEITMSEHSLLQYQRRVELVLPDEIEEKVITDDLKKMVSILGNGTYPICDGKHQAIIKNNVIITII